jgi:hypothetical protein
MLAVGSVAAACDALPEEPHEITQRVHDDLGQPLSETALAALEGNEEVEEEAGLLARVEVQPGEVLEFYEPSPGMIVVSGTGRPEGPPIIDDALVEALDITELWALASDEHEMPEALADALARAEERSAQPPPRPVSIADTPDAASQVGGGLQAKPDVQSAGYCDTGYFDDYAGQCPSGDDWQMCLNNWWNGAWGQHNDAAWGYTSVCPAQGNIAFKVFWSNGGGGLWTVNQNYYRWFAGSDWDCETAWDWDCPTLRVDVTQAAGDRFHLRMRVWE